MLPAFFLLGLWASIGRWFRAWGFRAQGEVDASRKTIDADPYAMQARWDEVITAHAEKTRQLMEAVATLMSHKLKQDQEMKRVDEQLARKQQVKAGALAMTKQRVAALEAAGSDQAAIKGDLEYQRNAAAYKAASDEAAQLEQRIAQLKADIEGSSGRIQQHKLQLMNMKREHEKYKSEAADSVARVISAKQRAEIDQMFAGLSTDGVGKDVSELRDLVNEAEAQAEISSELAGTSTQVHEEQLISAAREQVANDEFDALIFQASAKDVAPAAADAPVGATPDAPARAKLPEA